MDEPHIQIDRRSHQSSKLEKYAIGRFRGNTSMDGTGNDANQHKDRTFCGHLLLWCGDVGGLVKKKALEVDEQQSGDFQGGEG